MTDRTSGKKSSNKPASIRIAVGGNVGPGAVIGTGSVEANNIVGRDLVSPKSDMASGKTREDFSQLLAALRKLIQKAQDTGEIAKQDAEQAIAHLDSAAELVTKEKPSKRGLVRKLEDISEILGAASDTVESAGGAARVITHALPVTALLLNLVSYIF